jgi:RES domain-containing protein
LPDQRIEAWRLTTRARSETAFSGIGARKTGGRWNSRGVSVVYASSSIALAALEILVSLEDQSVLDAYVPIPVSFASKLVLPVERLPPNWREDPHPLETRELGDEWVRRRASPVLAVPSAVVPPERNYVLNPEHGEFREVEIGEPLWDFTFDARMMKGR